jgi:HK97 family phage prohead protease
VKELQTKSFPFECKANTDKGEFEGYASIFGNIDSYGDIVEPGAFQKTIEDMANRIKVLWNHNWMHPIGRPIAMQEDSKGLYVKAKISPTTMGKDVLTLLKDGVVNELSIGYSTEVEEWDSTNKTRKLKQVKLYEFSPVTWAANDMATITGVKSQDELLTLLTSLNGKMDDLKSLLEGKSVNVQVNQKFSNDFDPSLVLKAIEEAKQFKF